MTTAPKLLALAAGAAMFLGAGWVLAGGGQAAPTPTTTPTVAAPTPTPTTVPAPSVAPGAPEWPPFTGPPVTDAAALLGDDDRPWTLAVLGDSTGNDLTEWVGILAERLSETHDRPVVLHTWSADVGGYLPERVIGDGTGAEITIFNGSFPGAVGRDGLAAFDEMIPAAPDLTVLNYGHNEHSPQDAVEIMRGLVDRLEVTHSGSAVALIVQNPRVVTVPERHEAVVATLRYMFTGSGVALVDVHAAFTAQGDLAPLLRDGVHPSDVGSALWADVVEDALGL